MRPQKVGERENLGPIQHPQWDNQSSTSHLPRHVIHILQTLLRTKKRKYSKFILLCKKNDPLYLSNHKLIALGNTIYILYTSTLTTLLATYGERHILLHFNREGLCLQQNTTRQLQMVIAALQDIILTNKDIYLTYIDFFKCIWFNRQCHTTSHHGIPRILASRGSTNRKHILKLLHIIFYEPLRHNTTNPN